MEIEQCSPRFEAEKLQVFLNGANGLKKVTRKCMMKCSSKYSPNQ